MKNSLKEKYACHDNSQIMNIVFECVSFDWSNKTKLFYYFIMTYRQCVIIMYNLYYHTKTDTCTCVLCSDKQSIFSNIQNNLNFVKRRKRQLLNCLVLSDHHNYVAFYCLYQI